MTNIKEQIAPYLALLNHTEDTADVQTVIQALGGTYTVDVFDDDDTKDRYLSFGQQGIEFLLRDNIIDSIFITPTQVGENAVQLDVSRQEVQTLFGEPVKTTKLYDLYKLDDRFAHFEFDESSQQVRKLTLMAKDPLANSLTDPAEASTVMKIDGTLNTLTAAIGHRESDPEAQAAFALFESEYTPDTPSGSPDMTAQYLNFSGAHIQLKNDRIVSIYFTTGLLLDDPTPKGLRINSLIRGLAEKPMRGDVQTILGEPYLKDVNFELYNVNNTSVHVEYIHDLPDSISISVLPAKETYQ